MAKHLEGRGLELQGEVSVVPADPMIVVVVVVQLEILLPQFVGVRRLPGVLAVDYLLVVEVAVVAAAYAADARASDREAKVAPSQGIPQCSAYAQTVDSSSAS